MTNEEKKEERKRIAREKITELSNNKSYCVVDKFVSVQNNTIDVCDECFISLENSNIPKNSLVIMDPGLYPPPDLEPLKFLEGRALSFMRQNTKHVMILTFDGTARHVPQNFNANLNQFNYALKGHLIAFIQSTPGEVASMFPRNIDEGAENLSIFLTTQKPFQSKSYTNISV